MQVLAMTLMLFLGDGSQPQKLAQSRAIQKAAPGDTLRHRIEAVSGAQTAIQLGDAYRALFRQADATTVALLKAGDHPGIALAAAFKDVRLSLPEKDTGPPVAADTRKLHRFLGFLEGRLRVSIPRWWEKTFLTAEAFERSRVVFDLPDQSGFHQTGFDLWVPRDVAVEKDKGLALIKLRGQCAVLPEALIKEGRRSGKLMSVLFSQSNCFVAVQPATTPFAYDLHCIECKSGKVAWTASVWVRVAVGALSGRHQYLSESVLSADGNAVIVFGIGNGAAYVEGFRARDGASLFRFWTEE